MAFVLGALTGAAVALLMAPATGERRAGCSANKAREGREKARTKRRGRGASSSTASGKRSLGGRARPRSLRAGARRRRQPAGASAL